MTETLTYGLNHMEELSESYPMNTNMTGFRFFFKSLCPCALDKSSLSIGRVKPSCEREINRNACPTTIQTSTKCELVRVHLKSYLLFFQQKHKKLLEKIKGIVELKIVGGQSSRICSVKLKCWFLY